MVRSVVAIFSGINRAVGVSVCLALRLSVALVWRIHQMGTGHGNHDIAP